MLKTFLTLLFLIVLKLSVGQSINSDCNSFKTGTFTYQSERYNSVIIKRTERKQTEFDPKDNIKIKYKIRWTSNCEYEIIQVWSNNQEVKRMNGSIIKVKMTNVYANSYEYIADLNGSITKDTILRLKK